MSNLALMLNWNWRLVAFVIDKHGTLFLREQDPSGGGWSGGWEPLGSGYQITEIAVGRNQDGRLEVFGIDNHGTLLHTWQTTPSGSWVGGWEPLGSGYQITQVAVGRNYDGRLEVFGIDNHGTLLHTWQTTPGANWFTGGQGGWEPLGSGYQITQVAVGYNYDGRMEVFGVANQGTLLHTWQTTPSGSWVDGGWEPLGSDRYIYNVAVYQNEDGRMEVLANAGSFVRTYQTSASNGWSPGGWEPIIPDVGDVTPYPDIAVARDQEGCLELFALNTENGSTYPYMNRYYQSAPNNGWVRDPQNFWNFG